MTHRSDTIKLGSAVLAGLVLIALSFLTIKRFPPVNIDEVSNAVMADQFVRTGHIVAPLVQGVIHPYFADLNSVDPESLRGVYVAVLGVYQRLFGEGLFAQ